MFMLRRPTEADVITYLLAQREMPFSYADPGATCGAAPGGFQVDEHRVPLGNGRETFARARQAITRWQMFPASMTQLFWPDKPICAGTTVAVLVRGPLCWTLNPCRIVYVVDETSEANAARIHRFGFAYGTLPDHLECGEERFSVEWNESSDEVHYDLLAFSQPHHPSARLGYPIVRHYQAKFRELSGKSMQEAVGYVAGATRMCVG